MKRCLFSLTISAGGKPGLLTSKRCHFQKREKIWLCTSVESEHNFELTGVLLCLCVLTSNDQTLRRQPECDKVSVVTCAKPVQQDFKETGSLFNICGYLSAVHTSGDTHFI